MDISGRILREVEFRDRLRGYDTDEVDEFLEKVAVAVDELRAELVAVRDRSEQAEHAAGETTFPDDEAIRRTLVLAQRTADLAIKEAQNEAALHLEEARTRAEALLARAEEDSQHARDEAEFGLQARVAELAAERDRIGREVNALSQLLDKERERLGDALSSALRFVNETLTVSDEIQRAATAPIVQPPDRPREAPVVPEPSDEAVTSTPPRFDFADDVDEDDAEDDFPPVTSALRREPVIPDIESEISEDARTAAGTSSRFETNGGRTSGSDPDEDLWDRWAKGSKLGGLEDPFGPDWQGPGRSA